MFLFRIDHLYAFFLRWIPEYQSDPLTDDHHQSPNKGFVLLANKDPDLTDEYLRQTSKQNEIKNKKVHYLTKQNTLLEEWEVRIDQVF